MTEDDSITIIPHYKKLEKMKLADMGHTAQVKKKTSNKKVTGDFGDMEVVIPGQKLTYKVAQFHFHTSSEHTVEGKKFAMEMHLVHLLESGATPGYQYQKAVLGFVFDDSKNTPNPLIESLHPEALGTECTVDLPAFFEGVTKKIYHYGGSLTTPPCTEEVNW